MLSQTLNLLITPFVTGLVGYGTNWLAIKMLFRPHKKSLLSFGWQGVIPKNRAKLAREISILVGDKLLRREDIRSAFFSTAVQNRLEKAVEHELRVFLEKDFGSLADILSKSGYQSKTLIYAFLSSLNQSGVMDSIAKSFAETAENRLFSFRLAELATQKESIKSLIESVLSSKQLQEETGSAISSFINNFVMSGKSIGDIIPTSITDKIPALSEFLTEKILTSIEAAFEDENTREKISAKLVQMKDSHFGEGTMDKMKLGFLNMFLNEDTLKDIVDKYLPSLIKSVKESDGVKERIRASVSDYIYGFVNKPVYMHAGAIGFENIYSLKSSIVTAVQQSMGSESMPEKIAAKIVSFAENNPEMTLGNLLENAGAKQAVKEKIAEAVKPDTGRLAEKAAAMAENIKISGIYGYIPKKLFSNIKTGLIKEINKVIENNIDKIIASVDLPKITENRINSLDLYEVEKLLFSFMSDSFKWINILGFVLGFLFGAVQSILVYIFS